MSLEEIVDRKDRPAYVSFHRVAVEDKPASLAAGHYVAKDVDFVHITPPYSKDVIKFQIPRWLENMEVDVRNGRMPKEWQDNYIKQYQAWQNGQELPLKGTAIKGWGVISPAQQETLIRMNVLTVEDLALVTDEGIRRIGMGAVDLKRKAAAWLAQLTDKGPLTLKMAALESENAVLKSSVETLTKSVEALLAAKKVEENHPKPLDEITAADLLEEPLEVRYEKKFGKPPHHRMKPETIAAALE